MDDEENTDELLGNECEAKLNLRQNVYAYGGPFLWKLLFTKS